MITDESLLGEAKFRLGIAYRAEKEFSHSWRTLADLTGDRKPLTEFYTAVTVFAHMQSFPSVDHIYTELSKFSYANDNRNLSKQGFWKLMADTFGNFAKATQLFNIPMMHFFVAEYLGYIKSSLPPWQLDQVIERTSKLRSRQELDNKLKQHADCAIKLSDILLPSQVDANIRANWFYCLALMYYYKYICEETEQDKEDLKRKYRENIELSKIYAQSARYIYSEKRQTNVDRRDFLDDEIKILENRLA